MLLFIPKTSKPQNRHCRNLPTYEYNNFTKIRSDPTSLSHTKYEKTSRNIQTHKQHVLHSTRSSLHIWISLTCCFKKLSKFDKSQTEGRRKSILHNLHSCNNLLWFVPKSYQTSKQTPQKSSHQWKELLYVKSSQSDFAITQNMKKQFRLCKSAELPLDNVSKLFKFFLFDSCYSGKQYLQTLSTRTHFTSF